MAMKFVLIKLKTLAENPFDVHVYASMTMCQEQVWPRQLWRYTHFHLPTACPKSSSNSFYKGNPILKNLPQLLQPLEITSMPLNSSSIPITPITNNITNTETTGLNRWINSETQIDYFLGKIIKQRIMSTELYTSRKWAKLSLRMCQSSMKIDKFYDMILRCSYTD